MTTTTLKPLRELEDYVLASTVVYRKGEPITYSTDGHLKVITIDAFPALPDGPLSVVDCHFVSVGFTEALGQWDHAEFRARVLAAEHGLYAEMPESVWSQGPSYITIGAWIGDQTTAFRVMACIQAHGLGHVITPATLGVTDEAAANALAGGGYVLISGLKEAE